MGIGKRFAGINVENNAENRRAYRELLVTTEGLNEHISGVILFDETARDTVSDGRSMIQCLSEQGILAGIKVDKGPRNVHSGIEGETVTQGLDGLEVRAAEYYEMGAGLPSGVPSSRSTLRLARPPSSRSRRTLLLLPGTPRSARLTGSRPLSSPRF